MENAKYFSLGKWTVSPDELKLHSVNGQQIIEPKCMELLLLLAHAEGELVSRELIMERIWDGRYVSDYAVNNVVSMLRKHLGEHEGKSFIETIKKRGYKLTASVHWHQNGSNSGNAAARPQKKSLGTPSKFLLAISVFFVLLLVGAVGFSTLFKSLPNNKMQPNTSEQTPATPSSLAVLPLQAIGDENEVLYFADGLSEELIHQLSKLPDFKVISKHSSFTYRDADKSSKAIGAELGVDYLVQGSVRKHQEIFKVTIQLVDTKEDSALWSQSFSAGIDNIFTVQNAMTEQVVNSLNGDVEDYIANKRRAGTLSGEAYLHLLRGRNYNRIRSSESLLQARDQFSMATLLDPNFAQAYADLAVTYLLMGNARMIGQQESHEQASAAIKKALDLEPELAQVYAARGVLAQSQGRFEDALSDFNTALSFNENLYLALINYANLLSRTSDNEKALALYKKALSIAPLSGPANWGVSGLSISLGNFDDALKHFEACTRRLPEYMSCTFGYAYALRLTGQHEKADKILNALDKEAMSEDYYHAMAFAWQSLWSGNIQQSEREHESLIEKYGYNIGALQSIALVKKYLGKEQQWFARIDKFYSDNVKNTGAEMGHAQAAYLAQECATALPILAKLKQSEPNVFTELDYLANGVSYYAMLTHCYRQQGQDEQALHSLLEYENLLESIPESRHQASGFIYAKALYQHLSGDSKAFAATINTLRKTKWGLLWLIEKDPVLLAAEPFDD